VVIPKRTARPIRTQGAAPLVKGVTAPDAVNNAKLIDVNTASQEEIGALPQFIQEKIKSSRESE
jgi:DNA uptake protein ComE-like DNA-binding protein